MTDLKVGDRVVNNQGERGRIHRIVADNASQNIVVGAVIYYVVFDEDIGRGYATPCGRAELEPIDVIERIAELDR